MMFTAASRLLVLLSTLVIGSTASQGRADEISLFVVTGQSNARSQYALGIEAGLRASGLYDRVVIYNARRGGAWLNQWVDSNNGDYSPGSHLTNDLWATDGSSELQQLIASLEADGHTVTITGFFWFQGESDTINAGARATYQPRFTWMIEFLRDKYGEFDLLVTLIDWNHDLTDQLLADGYTTEGVEEVRDALQASAAALGGATHDSRGYPRADLWHVSDSNDPRGYYAPITDLGADQVRNFTQHTTCPADITGDDELNFFDISGYIQQYLSGCP